MWPFKKNKTSKHTEFRPLCPYCKSYNTRVLSTSHVTEEPNYIKTWRGQRYVTCRCTYCGRDFYIEEPIKDLEKILSSDASIIEDEEELTAAEEDLRRLADEENDHRFKGNVP